MVGPTFMEAWRSEKKADSQHVIWKFCTPHQGLLDLLGLSSQLSPSHPWDSTDKNDSANWYAGDNDLRYQDKGLLKDIPRRKSSYK